MTPASPARWRSVATLARTASRSTCTANRLTVAIVSGANRADGFWKTRRDVHRGDRGRRSACRLQSGQAMEERCGRSRVERVHTSREQCTADAGQHVTAPGGCEIWRVSAVDPDVTRRVRHERRRTLEEDDDPEVGGGSARVLEAVGLHIVAIQPAQPRELAGVRGEDRGGGPLLQRRRVGGEHGDRIRVDYEW